MIVISFDDAVNSNNWDEIDKFLSSGLQNPNGCDIKTTFFVSHQDKTNPSIEQGNEMDDDKYKNEEKGSSISSLVVAPNWENLSLNSVTAVTDYNKLHTFSQLKVLLSFLLRFPRK